MPEIINLNAELRPRAGKGAARATRRGGRVPGIVYGDSKEPVLISLEPRALARAVAAPGFLATLIDISVDGTTHRTLPRDVQHHPITDAPLHADFMRVAPGAQVTVIDPGRVHQSRAFGRVAPRWDPQRRPPRDRDDLLGRQHPGSGRRRS